MQWQLQSDNAVPIEYGPKTRCCVAIIEIAHECRRIYDKKLRDISSTSLVVLLEVREVFSRLISAFMYEKAYLWKKATTVNVEVIQPD